MHAVEALFSAMADVEPYPEGVMALPARIGGTAFFPGGAGLWNTSPDSPLPPMPMGGVMVLGHDFHSEAAFARSLAAGTEVNLSPTWPILLKFLDEAGIKREQCFFTNAYMGLRRGAKATGRFPGASNKPFVERCRRFLLRQLSVQQPQTILALGRFVPSLISPLSPQLQCWARAQTFAQLDAASPVIHGVVFPNLGIPACSVVVLTHPCLRGSNIRRRQYGLLAGHEAELAMVREAESRARRIVV